MRGQSNIGAAKAPIRMSARNENGVGVTATDFMCTPLTTILLDKYDVVRHGYCSESRRRWFAIGSEDRHTGFAQFFGVFLASAPLSEGKLPNEGARAVGPGKSRPTPAPETSSGTPNARAR